MKNGMYEESQEEAASKYAKHHSLAPDKETPDWIIADFKAGAEWATKRLIARLSSHISMPLSRVIEIIEQETRKVASLEKEKAQLKIEASNWAYQMDRAKQERDKAERENSSLHAQIKKYKEYCQNNGLLGL
jgi:hypothetical protein